MENEKEKEQVQQSLVHVPDISIEHWGIYEIEPLEKLSEEEFRKFIIDAYNGRPTSTEGNIYGYKQGIPLFIGHASQSKGKITKNEVIDFAKTIRTVKGQNRGIIIAWEFADSAREAAVRLEEDKKIPLELIKIELVQIESSEFREHITKKHKEYRNMLIFILPPIIRINVEKTGNKTYEFDVSESISMNSSGKIMNVQWDFNHKKRFTSTKGYSFIREKDNKPMIIVTYKFPSIGKKKIACRIQDDKGGEKTKVIELEVK